MHEMVWKERKHRRKRNSRLEGVPEAGKGIMIEKDIQE